MGDRGAAGQPQRGAHLGGDDHRQRGLAEPGRAGEQHVVGGAPARAGGLEHQAELLAHPLLADHLVEACGAAAPPRRPARRRRRRRRSASRGGLLAAASCGRRASARGRTSCIRAQALLSVRRAARSSARDVGRRASARPRARPRRRPGRPPWPTSRARRGPACTWPLPRRADAGAGAAGATRPTGAPIRSCSSRMIRWAPFWPMPGTVVSVLTSSAATARRRSSGPMHGQHRLGQLGADAAGGLDELEHLLLVVVERSRTASASPRAPPCWSAAWPRGRCAASASVSGRAHAARGRRRRPRGRRR